MSLFRALAALISLLVLTACIDAEIEINFKDQKTAEGRLMMAMSRQLYDMTAQKGEPCKDGEAELTADSFICRTKGEISLDELVSGGATPFSTEGPINPSKGARFERLRDNRLKATFDFADLFKDREEKPQEMSGMEDMLRAALAGHSFTFIIKAHKIIETTGTLSDDGKEARFIIPVVKLLDEPPDVGGPFVTTVQLAPECRFIFFCS